MSLGGVRSRRRRFYVRRLLRAPGYGTYVVLLLLVIAGSERRASLRVLSVIRLRPFFRLAEQGDL